MHQYFAKVEVFSLILSSPNSLHTHNQLPHGEKKKKKMMEMTAE